MSAGALMRTRDFKLHPRTPAPATVPIEDRGRIISAPEFAQLVCDGRFSAKWIIQRAGPEIGTKPGREWLFYETEARQWWADYLEKARRRA